MILYYTGPGQRGVPAAEGLRIQVPLRGVAQVGAGRPQVRVAADPQAARQVCAGEYRVIFLHFSCANLDSQFFPTYNNRCP